MSIFDGLGRLVLAGAVLAGTLSVACGRSRGDGVPVGSGGSGGSGGSRADAGEGPGGGTGGAGGKASGGTGATGGTGKGGTGGTMAEAGSGGIPEACVPSLRDPPLRQLTRFQYDNVLRDVLGEDGRPARHLPQGDSEVDLAVDGMLTPGWVSGLHEVAHDVALSSTASPAALSATLGCDLDVDGEPACEARLFERVLPRLLRRPLDDDDLDEFERLLAEGTNLGGDFASGVRMVLEVALQAPELLYRTELGEPLDVPADDPRAGWGRPSSFEMASRLSFLLWGSAPDDALLAEAAAGGLTTKDDVRAAAERLLDDERAAAVIRYVHERLLRLFDRSFPPNADVELTERLFLLMQSERAAFLDDVASSGPGSFELLVTAPHTYLNEELAAFYGIPDIVGPELRKVDLDSTRYSGILTQGSFLTGHSTPTATAPTRRGVTILEAFRCEEVDLPLIEPHATLGDPSDGLTMRERLEAATSSPSCAGCHSVLDGPGLALEHFDHLGRYRSTEADKPIDAAVDIDMDDGLHAVEGAPGLGRLLADSPEVHDCYVRQWAAYAYGASIDAPLDECSYEGLADVFARTNGDIRALLLELTQTDAFLYRRLEIL